MELHFPSEGLPAYTWFDYKFEKDNGTYPGSEGSFCRTFMEVFDVELSKCTGDYHNYVSTTVGDMFKDGMEALDIITGHERGKNGPQYNDMKQRCAKINMDYRQCRERINRKMVEFLFENDGVIDRWPYVEDVVKITIQSKVSEDPYKTEFPFAYFGDEYKPAGHKVYREKEGPVFNHKFYHPYESEELKEAKLYESEKHQQFFSHKARTGRKGFMKRFMALQPLIFGGLFLAFSLYCYFENIVPAIQVKEWGEALSSIPGILLFIPKVILYVFAYVSEILRFNNILFWIGTLAISLTGIFTGIKKITSPNLRPVSKKVLDEMWKENTDALEKRWAIEKEIDEVSEEWNYKYLAHIGSRYRN